MADADPADTEVRYITDADMAEGCCLCRDYSCACELVFGVTLTEDQEAALWLWMSSEEGRYQA